MRLRRRGVAGLLLAAAVTLLPTYARARYRQEFAAELAELPSASRRAYARRVLHRAPLLGWELRANAPARQPSPAAGAMACTGLLVTAGALTLWAAWDRWYPACWPSPTAKACWFPQDDSYDVWLASGAGIHPQLAARVLAFVLTAVCFLLLPRISPEPWPGVAAGAGALGALGMALAPFASRISGPAQVPLVLLMLLWCFTAGWMFRSATRPLADSAGGNVALWLVFLGLSLTNVAVDDALAGAVVRYSSHDTNPWMGAPTGIGFLVAATGMLLLAHRLRRAPTAACSGRRLNPPHRPR